MASYIYSILALLVAFQIEQRVVQAACPSSTDAETAAKACLTAIGFNMDAGAAGAMGATGDLAQLKDNCRDNAYDRAVTCVQDVRDSCKAGNPEAVGALDRLMSVEQLRAAFKSICDNINAVEKNAQCVAQQAEGMATCIQKETDKFMKRMQAMQTTGEMTPEGIQALTCEFTDSMVDCQRVHLETCGKEVVQFMTSFIQALRPPTCPGSSNVARPSSVPNFAYIFSALFITISLFLKL